MDAVLLIGFGSLLFIIMTSPKNRVVDYLSGLPNDENNRNLYATRKH